MELIDRGIYVRLLNLPMAVKGVTTPNEDDTYNVFINENLSDMARRIVLDHELRHIYSDHFNSLATLSQLE